MTLLNILRHHSQRMAPLAAIILLAACAVSRAEAAAPQACTAWAAMAQQSGMTPGMAASMGGGDMPGMYMLDAATPPMPLVCLTEHDPPVPKPYSDIGTATRPVPGSKAVQDYFDQGLRFYYAFNNRESYRAFRYAISIQSITAPCAICDVGEALALGVDINMMTELEPDRQAALKALAQADRALVVDAATGSVTPQERAFVKMLIDGLKLRFQDCPSNADSCQEKRNKDYQLFLSGHVADYRNDPDFAILYADSVMNLTPWSYWTSTGAAKSPAVNEAREMLEAAMAAKHHSSEWNDGLPHWYIHLMEMSGTPDDASPSAEALGDLAPKAGHLVHMPSHIFYRLGDMADAITANQKAIAIDETYFANDDLTHPDGDRYRYGYYPHNIHFLLAAASLSGDKATVLKAADDLLRSAPDKGNGFRADRYRAVYYLGMIGFADLADLKKLPPPLPNQPLSNVAYDYAQVSAAVIGGDSTAAAKAAAQMGLDADAYRRIDPAATNPKCLPNLPVPGDINLCLIAMMQQIGQARIDALGTTPWSSISARLMDAVTMQDRLPYDEPPPWLFPVRQTLAGLALLRQKAGKSDVDTKALMAVDATLRQALPPSPADGKPLGSGVFPGDGWTYYALWQLDILLKQDPKTDKDAFDAHWTGSLPPDLNRF